MPNIDPFEKHSTEYDSWFERNKSAYESELSAVKELLPETGKGVEVGAGSGRFALPLGIEIGVEPSQHMREIAEKRGLTVVDGRAENLPFDDASFDFALMVTTICFVDDIEKAFSEVYRVLKPEGSLIVGFVDSDSPVGRGYRAGKDESLFYKPATFYSVHDVIGFLEAAGFRDFAARQTIFTSPSNISEIEPVREGWGEGSFVVLKGSK